MRLSDEWACQPFASTASLMPLFRFELSQFVILISILTLAYNICWPRCFWLSVRGKFKHVYTLTRDERPTIPNSLRILSQTQWERTSDVTDSLYIANLLFVIYVYLKYVRHFTNLVHLSLKFMRKTKANALLPYSMLSWEASFMNCRWPEAGSINSGISQINQSFCQEIFKRTLRNESDELRGMCPVILGKLYMFIQNVFQKQLEFGIFNVIYICQQTTCKLTYIWLCGWGCLVKNYFFCMFCKKKANS